MSTNTPNEKGTPQSRTYTVNDIAAIFGIGRATAYKLAHSGALKTDPHRQYDPHLQEVL